MSGRLKGIERKMKENKELQKHIVNYAKTKEIYMEYRKSGYDKEFYEEHVEALLVHKAAKEAFGKVERIPKLMGLKNDCQELQKGKMEINAKYRNLKKMKNDIAIIKGYVQVLLEVGKEHKNTRIKKCFR